MQGNLRQHPTWAELEAGLAGWVGRWPDRISVESWGRTAENRSIPLVRLSDLSVPDDDKAVVLLSVTHADEISGVIGLLHLMRWLLSDDPGAARIRKGIVTLVMPCLNPDGYERMRDPSQPQSASHDTPRGSNAVVDWTWEGPLYPDDSPEMVAYARVAEAYQPDASLEVHGCWWEDVGAWDSGGFAWLYYASRAHSAALAEELERAVEEAGVAVVYPEEDSGRVKVSAPVEGLNHHFYYPNSPRPSSVSYLYNRYHTQALMCEAMYTETVMARCRRLLELGLGIWRHEFFPGYPVNQVGGWGSMTVSAWGDTAAKRRRSRVELWQKADRLCYGTVLPEPASRKMMAVCATSVEGVERWLGDGTAAAVLGNLAHNPHVDAGYLAGFIAGTPMHRFPTPDPKHWGDTAIRTQGYNPGQRNQEPIRNGLALRLYLPYPDAKVVDARINGHPVGASATDGYLVRHRPGTIVQYNIPPDKVGDIHIITCEYTSDIRRQYGFGPNDWQ